MVEISLVITLCLPCFVHDGENLCEDFNKVPLLFTSVRDSDVKKSIEILCRAYVYAGGSFKTLTFR